MVAMVIAPMGLVSRVILVSRVMALYVWFPG